MIWNRIKVLRAERDWTQADLAEKVGISRQAVISIEKYKYTPSLELALKLQKYLVFLLMKFSSIGRTNSMNEQIIILIFLVLALGATLWLYILKAKKQVEYKGDERWLTIQLKANQFANIANWTLIILLAIATSVPLFIDIQIMFTLDQVILFGELFIGLRNLLELIAIMYFDKQL